MLFPLEGKPARDELTLAVTIIGQSRGVSGLESSHWALLLLKPTESSFVSLPSVYLCTRHVTYCEAIGNTRNGS